MTKLNWDKADHYEPDPARVIEVPDTVRPTLSPDERKALAKRSEDHDLDLQMDQALDRISAKRARGEPLGGLEKMVARAAIKRLDY